jgi:hypothetical protein
MNVKPRIRIKIEAGLFLSPELSWTLFHEINSEPDRGGFLFLCQEHCTDKNEIISTGCAGAPFGQTQF